MRKYYLALIAALLIAGNASALTLQGGPIFANSKCFSLRAGKYKFHYSYFDGGGSQARMSIYLGICGKGFLGSKHIVEDVIYTSQPYQGEKDFRVKAILPRRYFFMVVATGYWTITKKS